MKNLYFKISILVFSVFLLTNTVLAHDVIRSLSKDLLGQMQHNLERDGYLIMGKDATYGVYDDATEKAFDKFEEDKENGKYIKKEIQSTTTIATTTEEIDEGPNLIVSFFKNIVSFFTSLF